MNMGREMEITLLYGWSRKTHFNTFKIYTQVHGAFEVEWSQR